MSDLSCGQFREFPCRYEALARERDELEEALEAIKQDMVLTRDGGSSKEMRFMKKVIKNLEVSSITGYCPLR